MYGETWGVAGWRGRGEMSEATFLLVIFLSGVYYEVCELKIAPRGGRK